MMNNSSWRKLILFLLVAAMLVLGPAVAIAQAEPHLVVNTYRLNLRSGPGVGHNIIATVAGGTALPVIKLQVGSDWIQVSSSAGLGWVNSSYAVARGDFSSVPNQHTPANLGSGAPIPAGAPHVVVNTAYLNVRTGPGVGHSILTTVKGGTALAVTAIQYGGVWYQVETSAGAGWVNRRYTVKRGDFAGLTQTGEPADSGPQPGIPAGAAYLVVNTAYLNVRSGPGVGHGVLTTVPGGTQLQVTAIDGGGVWHQVVTSAGSGWVNSSYTVARGNYSSVARTGVSAREGAHLGGSTPRAVVNTAYLNIRSGPGAGHGIVATVPGGTTLKVLGLSGGRGWYLVEGSFGQGWLNNHYTVFRGDFSQVRVVG